MAAEVVKAAAETEAEAAVIKEVERGLEAAVTGLVD